MISAGFSSLLFQDQLQRFPDSLPADSFPIPGEVEFQRPGAMFIRIADEHRAHAVPEIVAPRPGQSGYGYRHIGLQQRPHALRHSPGRECGHRALTQQDFRGNPQNFRLHLIAVADDPALVDGGASGNRRKGRSDTATGQTFGGNQSLPPEPLQHRTAEHHHRLSP